MFVLMSHNNLHAFQLVKGTLNSSIIFKFMHKVISELIGVFRKKKDRERLTIIYRTAAGELGSILNWVWVTLIYIVRSIMCYLPKYKY